MKNKFMRIAAVMLMLCLVTTCAISGTFAKYTTSADATDTARVAKWGVSVAVTPGAFAKQYATTDTTITDATITNSVNVDSTGDNLVAPGTDGSLTFNVAGTPEVAVKVTFEMTVTSDVVIPKDTVVAAGNTLAADYTPVVFTLTKAGEATPLATGTLAQIQAVLNAQSDEYAPNATLNATYTLSWVWDFEGANTNNAADTYLGNVAAGTVTDANTKTAINFNIKITATQVD